MKTKGGQAALLATATKELVYEGTLISMSSDAECTTKSI